MTEHDHSAEILTPQRIIDQYMAIPPYTSIGIIEEEKLRDWRECLQSAELDPEEQLLAAWIDVEYGFARQFEKDEETEPPFSADLFAEAAEKFSVIARHPSVQVNGLLRGQAMVGQGAARVLAAIAGRESIAEPFRDYLSLQAGAGRHILAHGVTTGSARAAMWADTLTVVMLGSQQKGDIVFPCSPRHVSPDIDGFFRYNALVIEAKTGHMHGIRVGHDGPPGFILVPPEMLGHEDFPSRSGYGTLEAIIGQQDQIEMGASNRNPAAAKRRVAKLDKLTAHTDRVFAQFGAHVEQSKPLLHHGAIMGPSDPREWYRTLPPGRHPFIVSSEALDAAISPLELRLTEGALPPHEAMELAWMYTEVALGRAALPTTRAVNIRGDIERAEEVSASALERLDTQKDTLAFCEASFGFASLAMYESVLCRDEITPEQAGVYCEALVVIGRRAAARFDSLPDKTSYEARQIDDFMQRITACLLATLEGEGAYVALAATPRQRERNGWDISIWSQTHAGFVPGRYGRLRIAEKEDRSTLADGIVVVTPQHMNQKVRGKRFATFTALADEFQDVPLPPKTPATQRRKHIVRAWQATARAIEAAEV